MPGGNFLESLNVQKLEDRVWSVSLKPVSCGSGIELLQIAATKVVSGNTAFDQAVFQPINGSENTKIVISREQAATPPVGGVFDVHLENKQVEGKHLILYARREKNHVILLKIFKYGHALESDV